MIVIAGLRGEDSIAERTYAFARHEIAAVIQDPTRQNSRWSVANGHTRSPWAKMAYYSRLHARSTQAKLWRLTHSPIQWRDSRVEHPIPR
jgi:hypothetical protein